MIKIGLTGGIGSGKSNVSSILSEAGFPVIDADLITKEVLKKYPEILKRVEDEFGTGFFDWQGNFKAREFGNHIFRFAKERIKYENIIMPYILKEIYSKFNEYDKAGQKLVILDAPTLIENKINEDMDYVVLVYVDTATQIARVRERDRLCSSDVLNRINSQMPLTEKIDYSDFIINSSGSFMETREQVDKLIQYLNVLKSNN